MRPIASCFIDEAAPYLEAHAATIEETGQGLVAAWFAGTREGRPDVGIWLARHEGQRWTEPVRLLGGSDGAGDPLPCWNPVLRQCRDGQLLLFYKVGPRPRRWWGMLTRSLDGGQSWSRPRRLPDGIYGPAKNRPLELAVGSLLIGSSSELLGWRCQIERTADHGETIERVAVLNHPFTSLPGGFKANQATLVDHGSGHIRAMCRTKQGFISECWSNDHGRSWSAMRATSIPHPNSGFDCLRLVDGRFVLAHHPNGKGPPGTGRSPLWLSLSTDGQSFEHALTIEDEPEREFSYPSLLQTRTGELHVVYTWKRKKIRHAVIDCRVR